MTAAAVAEPLVAAIRTGATAVLRRILDGDPDAASRPIGGVHGTRTPLHVVADWPGYFPNGPEVVAVLVGAGADPNARSPGPQFSETPLHWAASSDDVDVAAALVDAGADVEAADGSIGTPLDNAVGYRCWHVARLLVARGAAVDTLWHAAALGMLDRLDDLCDALLDDGTPPRRDAVSEAFWHACAGGQRRAAEILLDRGADIDWVPGYTQESALDVAMGHGARRHNVITWLHARGAGSVRPGTV